MKKEKGPLTVAELIKKLKKLPQDLEVMSEGCDCEGEVNGAVIETLRGSSPKYKYVLLTRWQ